LFCFYLQLAALRYGEDNTVLWGGGVIFEPKDDEVTGVWRKL